MSKTDTDLLDINRAKAGGTPNSPKLTTEYAKGRRINVFDYETAKGMPFLLSYMYEGDDEARVVSPTTDTPDGERMTAIPTSVALSKLHRPRKTADGALNVWYNLNFDANIFLKGLDDEVLTELRATNSATATLPNGKTLQLTYLPKKMLEIRDEHGDVSRHYDISQFTYRGTLEESAKLWVGDDAEKDSPSVEPSDDAWDESVRRIEADETAYIGGEIERYADEVIDYAKKDAELTYEVADSIISLAEGEVAEEIGAPIPFGKPYSTGYIAGDFYQRVADSMPKFSPLSFQRDALKAYAGGRFEIYERGRTDEAVVGPDINSAYPAVMDSLPSLAQLKAAKLSKWLKSPDYDDPIDVLRATVGDDYYDLRGYGFVKVRCTTDESRRIQPFAVKNEGRVEYPALDNSEVWTIAPIFLHAVDAGYVEDYEIIDGAAALPKPEFGPNPDRLYADKGVDIGGLYAKRKALEAEGRDGQATLIKIVLNSLYGKTCQINPKRSLLSDVLADADTDLSYEAPDDPDSIEGAQRVAEGLSITSEDLPNEAQRTEQIINGEPLVEEYEAGNLFNPAIAAYTTGMTRLKLHESVVSNGLEDDTLMLATDCMLVRADAFDGTDLEDDARSTPDKTDADAMRDALGGWDFDYEGDNGALVVASGVYEIYDSEYDDGVRKTKARGFNSLLKDPEDGGYPPIRDCIAQPDEYLTDDRTGIMVENRRPRTFGEVVFQGKSLRQIGEFFDDDRALGANMDVKRSWKRDSPTFPDLQESAEYGAVKVVSDREIDDSA